MRAALAALIFALWISPAAAADPIAAKDVGAHVGETVTVVGVLTNVHKSDNGKTIFWDIGGTYPENPLTAVIFKADMGKFPDVTPLIGKTLQITGKIEIYRDRTEIILKDISQVQVGG